jgi:hypothetical protein
MKVGDRVRVKKNGREGVVTELPRPLLEGTDILTGVHVQLDNPDNELILRGPMSYMPIEIEVID